MKVNEEVGEGEVRDEDEDEDEEDEKVEEEDNVNSDESGFLDAVVSLLSRPRSPPPTSPFSFFGFRNENRSRNERRAKSCNGSPG